MKYSEELSEKLNRLLEKIYDAEKSYRYAAENMENSQLEAFFTERAAELYDFSHELRAEVRDFGEPPREESSLIGDVHRAWMNLKKVFNPNKHEPILEEAIRGERAAAEEYKDVLQASGLPGSTRAILQKHKKGIENTLTKLKNLKLKT